MQFRNSIYLLLLSGLAGCASLPTNGPTRGQIEKSIRQQPGQELPIGLVEVATIADVPAQDKAGLKGDSPLEPPPLPTDLVGAGDVLHIAIYEAGVTLFSGAGAMGQVMSTPGVQAQQLPPIRVDDDGYISIPYAGRMNVSGYTLRGVETMIRDALRGMSQNPQVLITMGQTITNSIIVGGEVARPGRLVLQTNRERLSDVVALAGGYRGETQDLLARLFRGDTITDIRMNDLVDTPSLDIRIIPGDRLMLLNEPRSYSVLGASGRVAQFPFNRSEVTLAEALASAGGVNPDEGDPAAVFLFRYVKDDLNEEKPVVYHLNMMQAGTYFLAQRFVMKDKDVLYFGNAAANQPGKLARLVSQMFTPLMTVTNAIRIMQNN